MQCKSQSVYLIGYESNVQFSVLPPKAIAKSGGVAKYHVVYRKCVRTFIIFFSTMCTSMLARVERNDRPEKIAKLHSCTFPLKQYLGQKCNFFSLTRLYSYK